MSARQTRKRPASGSFQDQLTKRGRPSKADRDSQVPHDAPSRATARTMLRDHPPLKVDLLDDRRFYRELIETPIDDWSADDEAAVVADWNQSEAKSLSRDFSQRNALLATWKISLRLYKETPVTLLSLFTSLRYQPVSTNGMGNEVIYSESFCSELSKLMAHPCWEQKTTLLTLGLRWTVICRLDDRRIWELNRTYHCPALKALSQNIEECGDAQMMLSYHEMHKAAREAVFELRTAPSVLSDLLCNIGQAVSGEVSARPPVDSQYQIHNGFDVLPVTLWDLQVLSKAVNSTTFKTEWNYSVEEALLAWKAESKGSDIPAKEKLPLLYELAHLDLLRHYVVLGRKYPPTSASEGSRQDFVAPERQIPGATGAQRVVREGDTPGYESSFSHRTPKQNEQDCNDMATVLDGGVDVDSDGSVATPLNPDLSRPHGPIRPEITSTPMEDRPFRRERRYKALVDGEETEDEQEDLQRNQHHKLDSSQRIVPDRQGTTLSLGFGDRTSQFELESAYTQPNAPTQRSPRRSPHPAPIVPHASEAAFSQLTVPGEGSPRSHAEEVKSSLKRIENQNTRILNLLQPQTQETHQPVAHLPDQRRGKTDNTGTAGMVQVIESVGVNDYGLVRNLRSQIAQLLEENKGLSDTVKEKDQAIEEKDALIRELSDKVKDKAVKNESQKDEVIKELSDKVKFQKFEISDLHRDMATKDTALETERNRANNLETQLSELGW
ncbi:hypothetical protein LZL87_002559 [Fusarium oxysporum]|nr:hypothetical protein LZL87_002559 [Fusarium oxysporum]